MTLTLFYTLVVVSIMIGLGVTFLREKELRRGMMKVLWSLLSPLFFLGALFVLVKLIKWVWYF